jgi:hypothetical protein
VWTITKAELGQIHGSMAEPRYDPRGQGRALSNPCMRELSHHHPCVGAIEHGAEEEGGSWWQWRWGLLILPKTHLNYKYKPYKFNTIGGVVIYIHIRQLNTTKTW